MSCSKINRDVVINPKRSATQQGVMYMITSPSGKSYIGQTIQLPENRWNQHIGAALRYEYHCIALEAAIREYGSTNMKYEILLITNENMLDHYEVEFIKLYRYISSWRL